MIGKNLESNIFDYIYKKLSLERYNHTIYVYNFAKKLAMHYSENIYNVQIAALLHDCAKDMSLKESKRYILDKNIKIKYFDFLSLYAPQVLHSYIAADIAKNKFKITNIEILNAIKNHTVGRVNMSNCEKIIFVADSLSPDRKFKIRFISKKKLLSNLDEAFKLVLQNKINYVVSKFQVLHPDIIDIWNYYNK
ncbi:MAG: bis(5'-nucleosyl)-tetraphosphatase (symmetrical) YqeK [Endomicrobiia bacterium]|jgi:nicotinate-nucleotide adenylyltransferase|nr:bis(5'-nucleosyl)-tetraphosphatase (symmetrical) YqeK [Endomicrobiaceae bacterium]MDD3053446.1 bis(5'-nucleosyl)-tetraphosphatase (symmetrical) YqeK [Endomicrobiaceae bacterium]MDD3922586.1 bis(5'-nucleosyl)-tetraphosphatase (symmetrical) YqeK [Endomicrobiaceae bacterium]MDD5101973.1 bis(5'-nucleosyl)-tetraphosphatase (symmetrical) YqeK [Endomicrobiaceae bacterium]